MPPPVNVRLVVPVPVIAALTVSARPEPIETRPTPVLDMLIVPPPSV